MFFLLMLVAAAFIVWLYFTSGPVIGVAATIIYFVVLYVKRYTAFCMLLAYRKYAAGEFEKSFAWFERGYNHGMTVKQKVTYAYYLLREGRTDRSEEVLNTILAFSGCSKEEKYLAKSHHALVLMKTNREAEALEELLEIFPHYKNSTIYGSIGYLHIIASDIETAEKFNLEAYDYNSDDKVILDNMVQLYNKKGDYETAFSYAEKVMEKNPAFIEAYYNAAVAAKAVGKIDLAKEYLEKTKDLQTSFLSSVTHEDAEKLLEELNG